MKICKSNLKNYSVRLDIEDEMLGQMIKMWMIKRYDLAYDYDFPPRTEPKKYWYNPIWMLHDSKRKDVSTEPLGIYFRDSSLATEVVLRFQGKHWRDVNK
jgi:hypothetical protein